MSGNEFPEYWADVACMSFEDDLVRLMDRAEMSPADLARAIHTSPEYVYKILNGTGGNYQLKTMAKLGRAVNGVLEVRLIHEDDEVVRVLTLEEAEMLEALRGDRLPARASEPGSGASAGRVLFADDRFVKAKSTAGSASLVSEVAHG